jgi:hypothetical protein
LCNRDADAALPETKSCDHQAVRPLPAGILMCIAVTSCANAPYPAALFVPSDAEQMRTTKQYGGGVIFDATRLYPADAFLTSENEHLRANGFQPQTIDPFGQPTSQNQGWFEYTDSHRTPNTRVAQWIGYWKNQSGDEVMVALRYITPMDQSPKSSSTLHVSSTYLPAATVEQLRTSAPR